MKLMHLILMAVAITFNVTASDAGTTLAKSKAPAPAAAPAESGSWIDSITIAPLGAVRTVDLTGRSEWGAGLDLGVAVNPFVSIHVVNLAFEGPGQTSHEMKTEKSFGSHTTGPNSWGGSAIDETDLLVKARISRFSNESFSLYGIGGGLHTWGEDPRWGLSAGGGVELRFNKNFGVAVDYSVRMYSEADPNGSSLDSLVRALVNISF